VWVYKATGKLFNGISEGAGFGDDWQMETNYPIIRISNGTNTYYAKPPSGTGLALFKQTVWKIR